jgi:hypothetical protein
MNGKRLSSLTVCVLAAIALCGCQLPQEKYYWGHYEEVVYLSYSQPDKVPVAMQIQTLETDIQQAATLKKDVPPGVHAHLGYLYTQAGNVEKAKAEFGKEKQLYPESTVLVDRLIANLTRK